MESNGYCNLILDPDARRIAAVLDFEGVLAGDPLFGIVSMAWYLGRPGIADHGGKTCFRWPRFTASGPLVYRVIGGANETMPPEGGGCIDQPNTRPWSRAPVVASRENAPAGRRDYSRWPAEWKLEV